MSFSGQGDARRRPHEAFARREVHLPATVDAGAEAPRTLTPDPLSGNAPSALMPSGGCAAWGEGRLIAAGILYNEIGNLTRFDRWDASGAQVETVVYLYNGANQIACVDADQSGECDHGEFVWVYDAYGDLLDDGTHTYAYDAALRLTSVNDGVSTTLRLYDGDGDRVAQTVDENGITYEPQSTCSTWVRR